MKHKFNLYILSIILLIGILSSGIIAYNVTRQLNDVINNGKKELKDLITKEFRSFNLLAEHIQAQAIYNYEDKISQTAEYLNRNWRLAKDIPNDTLISISKRIDVTKITLISKDDYNAQSLLPKKIKGSSLKIESSSKINFTSDNFSDYIVGIDSNNMILLKSLYIPLNIL